MAEMGRPVKYATDRKGVYLNLSVELVKALDEEAGRGKRNEYIEKQLRALPAIARRLKG